MDRDNLIELLTVLDVERTPFTTRIFSIFDEDKSGEIDFREFVLSVWNYCTLGRATLVLFAFDLYDRDHSGKISIEEVIKMLRDVYGKSSAKNQQALFTAKELEKMIQDTDGDIDITQFREFVRTHPALLFPAFKIQESLQSKLLGVSFWDRCSSRRVEISKGKFLSIAQLMEVHVNKVARDQIESGVFFARSDITDQAKAVVIQTGKIATRQERAGGGGGGGGVGVGVGVLGEEDEDSIDERVPKHKPTSSPSLPPPYNNNNNNKHTSSRGEKVSIISSSQNSYETAQQAHSQAMKIEKQKERERDPHFGRPGKGERLNELVETLALPPQDKEKNQNTTNTTTNSNQHPPPSLPSQPRTRILEGQGGGGGRDGGGGETEGEGEREREGGLGLIGRQVKLGNWTTNSNQTKEEAGGGGMGGGAGAGKRRASVSNTPSSSTPSTSNSSTEGAEITRSGATGMRTGTGAGYVGGSGSVAGGRGGGVGIGRGGGGIGGGGIGTGGGREGRRHSTVR